MNENDLKFLILVRLDLKKLGILIYGKPFSNASCLNKYII